MTDYTKGSQTKKNRKKNDKRLDLPILRGYKDSILDGCGGLCQLCSSRAEDFHHVYYGKQGADKDDRYLIAVCRGCHTSCHQSKHGALSSRAKEIATFNWSVYNGEE